MKKIISILVILIFLGVGGFFAFKKLSPKKETEKPKTITSKKTNPVNLLALEKRPYVNLVPRSDGHEVSIVISSLKHGEEKVEYELEYQAGTMLQGAGGRIDFSEELPPVTKKLLFGSCSKGKCKYDEGINGGNLTLHFEGKEDYSLKGEFTLGKMSEKQGLFSSQDVKVSLDVGETGLPNDTFVIVFDTLGLPAKVEGKVLAGPVGFFTAGTSSLKKATLTFKRIKENLDKAEILGWDGSDWQEYEVEAENDSVSAEVDQLQTFVLVLE